MALEKNQQNPRRTSRAQRQKRRKRIRMLKIAGITGAAVLVLALLLIFLLPTVLPNSENTLATNPADTTPPPEDTVIHLVAGGDINITDKTVAAGLTDGGYNYTEVFRDVLPVLSAGDVTVLNFDGILSGNTYGTATKSAPSELMTALKNAGVDILQTANSYSVYDGLRGLNSTLQGVRAAGMTPLGTYANTAEFTESGGYVIWDIQGIKVAFVAFTKGMVDSMGLPSGSEDCVNLLYKDYNSTYQKVDTEGITQIVRNAAAHGPDVIVAFLHWGSEHNDQISSSQKKICNLLREEGVDAIIGTHSHYVQKMEFDPESGAFVAYSLGDFYGDGEAAGTNYSVILDLEITKNGATGEAKITDFDYIPIFINSDPDGKIQVLRLREAIQGYENQYLGTISPAEYQAMVSALERIKARTGVEK